MTTSNYRVFVCQPSADPFYQTGKFIKSIKNNKVHLLQPIRVLQSKNVQFTEAKIKRVHLTHQTQFLVQNKQKINKNNLPIKNLQPFKNITFLKFIAKFQQAVSIFYYLFHAQNI